MSDIVESSSPNPATRQLIAGVLSKLGLVLRPGKVSVIEWDRSGADELNLLAGSTWTVKDIYGPYGRVVVVGDIGPARNPELSYRINGDDLQIETHVTFPGLMAAHGGVSASEPVGAVGLLTILSCLSIVWSLLNPTATLRLPSVVQLSLSLNAGTLNVVFNTPPEITVVWGLRFDGSVNSVTLTESSVEIGYKLFGFARTQLRSW